MNPTERIRVLWLVESRERALSEAQAGAFAGACDSDRVQVDLLALKTTSAIGSPTPPDSGWGSVDSVGALSRGDIGAFLRMRRRIKRGEYDLIHAHGSWPSLWGALSRPLHRVPLVATLYHTPGVGGGETTRTQEAILWRALRRWGNRIIALSRAQWDRYVHDGIFSRPFLETISPGVEVDETPPRGRDKENLREWLRAEAGFPSWAQIAVTVPDLDDWESGVDVLLWALPTIVQANRQARLVIVGDGAHRSELERRVRARGLNKFVCWRGPDQDLRAVLAGSDLFVHPSLRDPFPVVALKGMAVGLPVIGTRVGGVPEIIGTTETGRLVPRSDAEALARAVVEMLQNPEALASAGDAAHRRVHEMFALAGWVDRMTRLYRTVIDEVRRGHAPRKGNYARLNVELLGIKRRATETPRTDLHPADRAHG